MTAWDKTLANFKAKKASGDPYWEAGEMVPVHELLPYREYNRKTQPKYPGHLEDVKNYVQQNGIDDMGILSYNPDTHRVYQSEGNTRLAVAQELGFSHVPVRVYRSGHEKRVGGIAPRGWDRTTQGRPPADIRPSQIGFTAMKLEDHMNENDISRVIREANLFLDEDDSFWDKTKSAVSNAVSGARDFTKALFSPSTAPPAGSAAPGFAPKDTSTKALVQTKLDTVLGQAKSAAAPATSPASTPMHNSVSRMINAIAEGNFDWKELDNLYGNDFRDVNTPKGREVAQVHAGYKDVSNLLTHHGYKQLDNFKARSGKGTALFVHPDGHTVDVSPHNLEWNHYQNGEYWTSAGRGIGDLDDHLRGFHRAW